MFKTFTELNLYAKNIFAISHTFKVENVCQTLDSVLKFV